VRRQVVRNPFSVLFVFYLLAFGVFFFYSIFSFPAGSGGILGVFQWPYIWTNSFILFMKYCIPITVAAVVVAYSLLPTSDTVRFRAASQPFSRLVTSHLVTFITLAVIYTVLVLGLYPLAQRNMEQFLYLSRQALSFLEQAEEAMRAEDKEEALHDYQRYLAIDGDNRKVRELASDLQMELIAEVSGGDEEETVDLEELRMKELAEGKQPYELLVMAQEFYNREDYFSAYYYADLAFRLDPSRTDAQRLAARAQEMIGSKDLSKLEAEEKQLFARKQEGYEYFVNGEYLQAYNIFRELNEDYPGDADIVSFLRKSQEQLSKETFFLDQARTIDQMPGATELLFVNYSQDGEKEIVFLGKLAGLEQGIFCKDIEVVRFTTQGLLYHYYASYGKLDSYLEAGKERYYINLHGVDRTAEGVETLPRYISGSLRPRENVLPNLLPLKPGLVELRTLEAGKVASATEASLGFFPLWQIRGHVAEYGYLESFVAAEILRRTLLPFSFLILSLLAVALGWRFRVRFSGPPPRFLVVFMPLFPLVAVFVTSLFLHAQRLVLSFVLLRFGFTVSLAAFLILQGLLLLVVMVLLAGQSTD
jgi:hypothetical protein